MTTIKRITDLTRYTSVLPYASELFGVYQPLIGWNSKRIKERFDLGFQNDRVSLLNKLKREFAGIVDIVYKDNQVDIRISPGVVAGGRHRHFDNVVMERISSRLPDYANYDPSVWSRIITPKTIDAILKKEVVDLYTHTFREMRKGDVAGFSTIGLKSTGSTADTAEQVRVAFEDQVGYESAVGGWLLLLAKEKAHQALEQMFYSTRDRVEQANALIKMLAANDGAEANLSLDNLNPRDRDHLKRVALSPIGVVHLFRQYFFELDTFLGPPENHVWLSPGSSVELLEVHTRRSTVEKTLESVLDTLTKSEITTTQQEEISEAVKDENDRNIKFGASVTASYASIEATASFDYSNSQKQAREISHKQMRQQTQKLSTEIRRNFKSTFKTVTAFADESITKHLLANSTDALINYELRRKMRQVGVQVQDIGTFLCWQTYVDDPGKQLGVAELIHIAKPAELDALPHPEEIPPLEPFHEEKLVTIPFISIDDTDADNKNEVYVDGVEVDDSEWQGNEERIRSNFRQEFVCPKANYDLNNVEFDPQGKPLSVSRRGAITPTRNGGSFTLHLDSVDFEGRNSTQVKLTLHWTPKAEANEAIRQKNEQNIGSFKASERAAYRKAYVEAVKERVTLASKIVSRNGDDLREEERIVVYRQLIHELLLQGVPLPDDRTRHVVAELINSIFDVDKMLYFVAPEWWSPRLHRSRQQLQEKPGIVVGPPVPGENVAEAALQTALVTRMRHGEKRAETAVMDASTVTWGGLHDVERDNYYITDESEPAKLGSSLGWLLQLDGDNMRNAFLNAPWVKTVIPIRPGKEEAAINWLKGVEGMNGITDDVIYHAENPDEKDVEGNPLEGQKMIDVLLDLAEKINRKHDEGIESGKFPKASEVSDPALVDEENTVTATPIDRVYEHGFFPLERSFRANVGGNYEIFDQWIEILPTDQTVPVEVVYDPKTGRQI